VKFSKLITSNSEYTKIADLEGHILLIEPIDYRPSVSTANGNRDAVTATIHDITAGQTHTDFMIFSSSLVGKLKVNIGQQLLVQLDKGIARPGQSAPYTLTDLSDDPGASKDAERYLADIGAITSTEEAVTQPVAAEPSPAELIASMNAEQLAALATMAAAK